MNANGVPQEIPNLQRDLDAARQAATGDEIHSRETGTRSGAEIPSGEEQIEGPVN
jgi:hypothetical protein